ncbi:Hypothetical protein NTJ_05641 [Nesidiocoris tenuis]|uniref:Proteasome assembly chaperone 1 n=1 Tax=Nesidiocoris tenuis TaxID=355587 RepID=A0ABN7AKS2_9HEMI|nr:Hypothetical protein NTJ_05641 [Nesidiocoris tenuis]
MCSFFGEIVFPSSRVFFDDSDDEEGAPENPRSPLEIKEQLQGSSFDAECNLLIISEGNVARGFTDAHLIGPSVKAIARIVRSDPQISSSTRRTEEASTLYQLNETTRLLDVSSSVDILLSNNLTVLLQPVLKSTKKIVVLCSRLTVDYRCDSINNLPNAFIRTLKSSSWREPVVYRTAEQPNFVSGFPASVASWSETMKKPCLVAVCYSDTDRAEKTTVGPFLELFALSNLGHLVRQRAHITYKQATRDESNMYM